MKITYQFVTSKKKRYGFWTFLFDLIMTGLTCGVWLVWLFIKFLRTNTR